MREGQKSKPITNKAINWLGKRYGMLTHKQRCFPHFIIIGVQKGGTSSLFHYLAQHPQMALPQGKEIHYFDKNHHRGEAWYKAHFPLKSAGKITGEASPYYIFHPHVPQRVKAACPHTKLIVMFRNPIDRAFSHFNMIKKMGYPKGGNDFESALNYELEQYDKEAEKLKDNPDYYSFDHQIHAYLERGKYYQQLTRWFKHFDKNQFLLYKKRGFFRQAQAGIAKGLWLFGHLPHFSR